MTSGVSAWTTPGPASVAGVKDGGLLARGGGRCGMKDRDSTSPTGPT